ncbi:hypothetical protein PF011_g5092 [Phytophthora fragariae]|uniref:Protein NRDE2 n=1 Tax=Phytophthora fragariae TaxID=53985 RepID=A0A6A3LXY5_9STRA|nr:hypothetical protein PF011_g5092 [Phytophthora fragariae]
MFAAGRKAAASSEAGAEGSDAAQAGNDWLSVGKSFPSGTSDDKSKSKHKETEASESVMQVYKHSKHRHKDKKRHKEKKRCDEESCDVAKREKRHLSKHKKKSKDRKRRRSWSRSDSSDGDDTHRSSRRRRRSRSNPRSRSRSRSQSRSDRDENRIVTQSDKTLTPHETEENEKLFEFDSVGDRENRFFGSTYAHDQPLYNLATRRNLLTGAWISQTRPKFSGDKMSGKREEKEKSDRYFSMQARKMEKDGRRRRLYLAYSEKRLSRAAATRQGDQGDQTSRTTRLAASCLPEMSFIPVDPILDINKFVANDIDEEPGHVTSTSDDTKEAMLTDGQSAEQHLVERSKLLNAAVAANPRDVDKWLDLIAFQDETLRLPGVRGKNINSAMRASVAEKQAAIWSKALTKNPHSRRLHRVKLNMTLQVQVNGEGAELDSFQRQLETLLSQDLTNSDLWIKLLQCRQQHFGSFSIQSVRDLYARILTVLRPEVEKEANTSTKTPSPTPGLDDTPGEDSRAAKFLDPATMLLDFHLLMCVFEKKAGYVERSIAQTQALIDFNLNESAADKETGIHVNHLEMLREFGSRWNKDGSVGLGNEQWNTNAGEDVLRDPSKVAFIRRVFKESLSAFQNVDDKFGSILKCLWIGFEAEVTSATGADETFLMYARGLSQKLVQKSADHDTDFDVLFAYAKLEHKLGNERQVRRICDNTLASLRTPSSSNANLARSFHRFAFLRARIELWPSTEGRKKLTGTLTQDQGRLRVLRCLFTLWNALQPEQQKEKEKETLDVIAKLHRKRLRNYLEELLTSDPSTETDLITRYRAELRYAIWQCTESCPQSCGGHTSVKRSHYQSGCWAGYCLHNLALVVYAYQGFEAACHEYRQGLANAEHQACSHLKWMWTCFLGFMQQHQASGEFPAVAPRAWRSSIGKAVEIFPNEALFLRLFVDAETGNTISQVLRNYFLRVEKRWQRHYDSPELVEWLFSLLCEVCRVERAATIKYLPAQSDDDRLTCCLFHRWGMNNTAVTRIRQTFESMVNHIRTKGNALCWRLYMRFEIALGKVEAAKKVLYRGIAACAWSKALYMDGLRMLRAYLSEDECHEILELLEAKELNVRVDFE